MLDRGIQFGYNITISNQIGYWKMYMTTDIKILRKTTDMTQKEFAAMFEIPLSTYRKWEQNEAVPPKYVLAMIERLLPILTKEKEMLRHVDSIHFEELGLDMEIMYRDICTSMIKVFGEKLDQIILYGSYARGDYDAESDIDIAVIADGTDEELSMYRRNLVKETSRFLRQYDKLVSLHEIPLDRYNKYKEDYPFYRNINTEGVTLYA